MHSSNLFIPFAVVDYRYTTSPINPRTYWRLHECEYTGVGTTLMVFDTGIDKSHPSFSSKSLLLPQGSCDDEDKSGHGTLCAGVACGVEKKVTLKHGGKPLIVCGVAPNAKLGIWKARKKLPKDHKDLEYQHSEFKKELKLLTEYVQRNTFEKPPFDVLVIPSGMPKPDTDMNKHIETLDGMGIIIVCAASNYGAESNGIAYPARFDETICIGSNTPGYKPSDFSPVGDKMDFLAIGENIIGPKSKNYDPKSEKCVECERKSVCLSEESSKMFSIYKGTSFSAPAVGGLICLILETLKSNQRDLRIAEKPNRKFIKNLLKHLTNKKGGEPWDQRCGFGAIDPNRLKIFFDNPMHIIQDMRYANEIMSPAPIS